ncbi:MAG: CopD family protein [Polyangiaceae bacterium]
MEGKSFFEWHDVFFQYVGFLSSFAMLGAIGFRYGVLRTRDFAPDISCANSFRAASARAAAIGFIGVLLGVVSIVVSLLKRAESKHTTLAQAFTAGGITVLAQTLLLAALLVLFILAWRRISLAWPAAAAATLAFALRNVLNGNLKGMVNPLHVLGASLWIGTLFVLVVCGVDQMLRASVPVAERESAVAEMVHRFSIVALCSAGLLGITGLITAWNHLNPLAALWTTPYGYVLIAKLCVVAIVAALGAWNWRRVGPSLGKDGGARAIRRSASIELAFAAVVLALTAILVSVSSPKSPPTPVAVDATGMT